MRLLETRHAFDWAYNLLQFFICYWEKFINLSSLLHNLTYLSLFNSFSFTFSVFLKSLNNYFSDGLYKPLLSRSSVLINYTMWSFNLFTASSCFPQCSWRSGFSGSRFFWVRVQGLGPGFRSSPYTWVWICINLFNVGQIYIINQKIKQLA